MKRVLLWAALLALSPALPASAQDGAASARSRGQVGERYDGYLGYAVRPSSALVRSQTEAINIRRRKLYTQLAVSRGVSPQEVGITAGCALLARIAVGEVYMLDDGVWRRRAPGQPAPVPAYCNPG